MGQQQTSLLSLEQQQIFLLSLEHKLFLGFMFKKKLIKITQLLRKPLGEFLIKVFNLEKFKAKS